MKSDWSNQKCYHSLELHLTSKLGLTSGWEKRRWQFDSAWMWKRHPHVIKQLWRFLAPRLQGRKADCLWNPWRVRRAWRPRFIDMRPDTQAPLRRSVWDTQLWLRTVNRRSNAAASPPRDGVPREGGVGTCSRLRRFSQVQNVSGGGGLGAAGTTALAD